MLKIIDITKAYAIEKKESVLALKGVSIEFRRNEFVSILGPSGCGKTTLLNIIGGLDRYTSGDIQIEGISTKEYDDVDWDTYRNRRIGFVFQSYNLIPHMNILKNVALSLTLAGVEREERYRRAQEVLEKVGLGSQAKKRPNQLSGGQMQRVAIARALVNNPEIILADEPTGALDSESGLQVMDLLKEVARDRLVIMVTHNPSLAEEYSTRIVYLKDGQVDGDTMPYNSEEEPEGELPSKKLEDADLTAEGAEETSAENLVKSETAEPEKADAVESVQANGDETAASVEPVQGEQAVQDGKQSEKPAKKESKLAKLFRKRRAQNRTSMKLRTAISLSWNNLLSKKGRTLLTSIAGSIGIIGIILVLSLSNGAKGYIDSLEENALSSYPLTISRTNLDIGAVLSIIMKDEEKREKNPNSSTIYTQKVLGKVMENFKSIMSDNDLVKFKSYIDDHKEEVKEVATVSYNYGIKFNAYIEDPKPADEEHWYMKVYPYQEVMETYMDSFSSLIGNKGEGGLRDLFDNATSSMAGLSDAWGEMSSNQKLLDSQYELVGSESRWPTKADEVVIVVDNKNQLVDYQLFMLGLKSQNDILAALASGEFSTAEYQVEDLLNLRYKIMTEIDYFIEDKDEDNNGLGSWTQHNHSDQSKSFVDDHSSIEIKVVGVVRPKPGVEAGSISGVIGYTEALTELLIDTAEKHPAIKEIYNRVAQRTESGNDTYKSPITFTQTNNKGELIVNVKNGDYIEFRNFSSEKYYDQPDLLRSIGVANLEEPLLISFYCNSFDSKEKIVAFIDRYNEETGEDIRYSDNLAIMMSFVNTMANTITGVLVAFAAVSLVVSTIMIAIIIYTSVLERRKEIGVLRSIGARKKDISRVFLAESAILGGYSGFIGILVSYILSLIGTTVLELVFEISGLMSVVWWHCVIMFIISILLSMFAGFIPSRIAAKKDPAIALRSE